MLDKVSSSECVMSGVGVHGGRFVSVRDGESRTMRVVERERVCVCGTLAQSTLARYI